MPNMPEPRWLSPPEQRTWRRWLTLGTLLPAVLHRNLQEGADVSLPDFDVLVQLTETFDGRARVTDLAEGLNWGRSRLSHHLRRMERRRLIDRTTCPEDGRGAWVILTQEGRDAIEQAAPAHVELVRELVFDTLTPEELESLSRIVDKLLAQLAHHTDAASVTALERPHHADVRLVRPTG